MYSKSMQYEHELTTGYQVDPNHTMTWKTTNVRQDYEEVPVVRGTKRGMCPKWETVYMDRGEEVQ